MDNEEQTEDTEYSYSNESGPFHENLFSFLVGPVVYYSFETFFENVKVNLTNDEIDNIKNITKLDNCIICHSNFLDFKKLECCNQIMCIGCSFKWFKESVYCPFCKNDMRSLINLRE